MGTSEKELWWRLFRAAVITTSDKGYAGQREDESGTVIKNMLSEAGYELVYYKLLPDERASISKDLKELCDENKADLILTTGGTGFSPRDITPEATGDIAERLVPGIAEAMRAYSLQKTNRAMLGRGISAIRGKTLIINLPGSPKAAKENLEAVLPALEHGLEMLTGRGAECAARFE